MRFTDYIGRVRQLNIHIRCASSAKIETVYDAVKDDLSLLKVDDGFIHKLDIGYYTICQVLRLNDTTSCTSRSHTLSAVLKRDADDAGYSITYYVLLKSQRSKSIERLISLGEAAMTDKGYWQAETVRLTYDRFLKKMLPDEE